MAMKASKQIPSYQAKKWLHCIGNPQKHELETEWYKILVNYTTDRGLISWMYNELQKCNSSKIV